MTTIDRPSPVDKAREILEDVLRGIRIDQPISRSRVLAKAAKCPAATELLPEFRAALFLAED